MSSLSSKVLVTMVVLFGVIATGASLLSAFELRVQLLDEYRSKASALATSIAESDLDLVINRDLARLQSTIDQYLATPGVAYVYVEDATGEVVAHTFVPGVPEAVRSAPRSLRGVTLADPGVPDRGSVLHVTAPILGGVGGHAHVGMDLGLIRARILRAIVRVQLLVLAIFLLAVAVAVVLVRRVSGPLHSFAEYARRLGGMDPDEFESSEARLETRSLDRRDEIGVLARAFSDMEEQLRDSIRHLRATTAAKERIESELRVARQIQANILPRALPPSEAHRSFDLHATVCPARDVAGDFYDFFLRPEARLYFAVGDVSGKGIPASLFMAVTATLLRASARESSDPAVVLSRVNQELCRENESAMFVTLFLGVLDLGSGRLRYCNAGHNPPILLTADGTRRVAEGGGALLGCFDDVEYRSREITLARGDGLFLYTDGVTEATNASEELFGEQRLHRVLRDVRDASSVRMSRAVLDAVERHESGREPSDDVTVLALRYRTAS